MSLYIPKSIKYWILRRNLMKHTLLVSNKKTLCVYYKLQHIHIVTICCNNIDCKQKRLNIHRPDPVTLVRPI